VGGRQRFNNWRGPAIAAAAAVVAACQKAPAPPAVAPPPSPQSRIDAALAQMYADSAATGMVVTVVRGDQATARGFGRLGPTNVQTPDGKTLVRLESVSKLFASDLLSANVAAGQVKLGDPLSLYAPKGWRAPRSKDGAPITLMQLASHTSGLPRVAPIAPTLSYSAASAARWGWLAKQRKLPAPGKGALYSNIAFDMLGDALATADRSPYPAALKATVTAPLGMADTTVQPSAEQCARMLAPDPVRPPHPCIDQAGEAASGGLYSTADDMGLWLKGQLAPGAAADRRRISQATYVQRADLAAAIGLDHAGPASAIGLGWIEQLAGPTHPRILEKTGGGDGFLTYVVIDPVARVGVFVAFDNVSDRRLGPVSADANSLIALLGSLPPG
jgi:D-alanyl-D-alanine-carboxypeptidase/D-alanyl-D-alanine-endopeptidase